MIELNNVTKVYKTKAGSVKALDGVSLTLPEKGMVFILGKSGCGKSTMLNILGGLDRPTSGELIVKGRSSAKFGSSDFDSYRNTCVGFIFQEYNVLPEFSVKQNIVLASELRNDRDFEGKFKNVTESVELNGLEGRKPGTLSGGQKQRVAIARALIKDPEIILADEPTGALDSVTGKNVLEILRTLSETKLVVVVSHDREFAEKYADRIVELFDGKIVSDRSRTVEKTILTEKVTEAEDGLHVIGKADADLLDKLNELLAKKHTVTVYLEDETGSLKSECFKDTELGQIEKKTYTPEESAFIRSKFPLRYAARMGASGMKAKPFRLILTIFLATIALTAFGFMLTLMSYDQNKVLQNALNEGGQSEIGVALYSKTKERIPVLGIEFDSNQIRRMDRGTVARLEENTGVSYLRMEHFGSENVFRRLYIENAYTGRNYYYPESICGFTAASEEELARFGMKILEGAMPEGSDEMMISEWMAKALYHLGAVDTDGKAVLSSESESPVGKTVLVSSHPVKICGVFSSQTPDRRFDLLKNFDDETEYGLFSSGGKDVQKFSALARELEDIYGASFMTMGVVSEDFISANRSLYDNSYRYGSLRMTGTAGESYLYPAIDRAPDARSGRVYLKEGASVEKGSAIVSLSVLTQIAWDLNEKEIISSDDMVTIQTLLLQRKSDGTLKDEALEELYSSIENFAGGAFENARLETSDETAVTVTIVGCYNQTDSEYDSYFYLSEADFIALYPEEASYDPEGADFLLTLNTVGARRALTARQFRRENRQGASCYDFFSSYQNDTVSEYTGVIGIFSKVFMWVGIVHAIFASLLLFNFISVSINYKKKDIGILRALGARKVDVFKVFFSESLFIIGICYALSASFSLILSIWFNVFLKNNLGVSSSLFFFGPLQALILAALAVLVSFISTILPVHHHAKKPPVDAIRAL